LHNEKDWNQAKAQELKRILVTGFKEVEYHGEEPAQVPGLFAKWEQLFPASLPWLRDGEREKGRQQFLRVVFRGQLQNTTKALMMR